MHTQLTLMRQTCRALSAQGDVYTDARECRPAVLRAQNLAVLAGLLASTPEKLFECTVYADGNIVFDAQIGIDGRVVIPSGAFGPLGYSGTQKHEWTLCIDGYDDVFRLALFSAEDEHEATWIIDEPEAFYRMLLKGAV